MELTEIFSAPEFGAALFYAPLSTHKAHGSSFGERILPARTSQPLASCLTSLQTEDILGVRGNSRNSSNRGDDDNFAFVAINGDFCIEQMWIEALRKRTSWYPYFLSCESSVIFLWKGEGVRTERKIRFGGYLGFRTPFPVDLSLNSARLLWLSYTCPMLLAKRSQNNVFHLFSFFQNAWGIWVMRREATFTLSNLGDFQNRLLHFSRLVDLFADSILVRIMAVFRFWRGAKWANVDFVTKNEGEWMKQNNFRTLLELSKKKCFA